MTDPKEVLARSTQAIEAFTNAERVFFYLYDRNTHRLEASLPAFNLTEELASQDPGLGRRAVHRRHGVPNRRAVLHQRLRA